MGYEWAAFNDPGECQLGPEASVSNDPIGFFVYRTTVCSCFLLDATSKHLYCFGWIEALDERGPGAVP